MCLLYRSLSVFQKLVPVRYPRYTKSDDTNALRNGIREQREKMLTLPVLFRR